jgi:hypothetical protein
MASKAKSKSKAIDFPKVLKRINAIAKRGFCRGMGDVGDRNGNQMCVEAAICTALEEVPKEVFEGEEYYYDGGPGIDQPSCVPVELSDAKIELNDSGQWDNDDHRAEFLLPLAIAQLGSKGQKNIVARIKKAIVARWNDLAEEATERQWQELEKVVAARDTDLIYDLMGRIEDRPVSTFSAPVPKQTISEVLSDVTAEVNGHNVNISEVEASILLLALKDVKTPGSKHVKASAYKKAEDVLRKAVA